MTIQQLYRWAEQNKCLNLNIVIEHRDEGGSYGTEEKLTKAKIVISHCDELYGQRVVML